MLEFLKMLLNWRLRVRENIKPVDPPRCICGGPYVPTAFMAPDAQWNIVEFHGLCCATEGCAGNFAEQWAAKLALTQEANVVTVRNLSF